jgi:hypothetical protein
MAKLKFGKAWRALSRSVEDKRILRTPDGAGLGFFVQSKNF